MSVAPPDPRSLIAAARDLVRVRWSLTHTDAGLLVLRLGTGLSLFSLFGFTKLGWLIALARTPDPLRSWEFPQLIASVGFPVPVLLAFWAIFNETVIALLVATGTLTRAAAALGAVDMAGAMYTSVRIAEEPLRAALYVVAFATLACTGPGRYSVDGILRHRLRKSDYGVLDRDLVSTGHVGGR